MSGIQWLILPFGGAGQWIAAFGLVAVAIAAGAWLLAKLPSPFEGEE